MSEEHARGDVPNARRLRRVRARDDPGASQCRLGEGKGTGEDAWTPEGGPCGGEACPRLPNERNWYPQDSAHARAWHRDRAADQGRDGERGCLDHEPSQEAMDPKAGILLLSPHVAEVPGAVLHVLIMPFYASVVLAKPLATLDVLSR